MPSLLTQRDFRGVQGLPFCYVCGRYFLSSDAIDRDHIPALAAFAKSDRTPCLWLPTHKGCNAGHAAVDQKIGQLIALRRGEVPARRDRQLRFRVFRPDLAAVVNLEVDDVVWRWIRGFHAALYREGLPAGRPLGALKTPFPRASQTTDGIRFDRLLSQHAAFVHTIKTQRAKNNLDTIRSNNGKLIFECVWCQADHGGPWLCVFAYNLYDWKDLGLTPGQPARGCAGFYQLPSGQPPEAGTRAVTTPVIVPNFDPFDPFGR